MIFSYRGLHIIVTHVTRQGTVSTVPQKQKNGAALATGVRAEGPKKLALENLPSGAKPHFPKGSIGAPEGVP